jgi:hypothetical protein
VSDRWSPQITIGTPVLIPEDYVADLSVRLGLYRRLADLEDERRRSTPSPPSWSTASGRCRRRSSTCFSCCGSRRTDRPRRC